MSTEQISNSERETNPEEETDQVWQELVGISAESTEPPDQREICESCR